MKQLILSYRTPLCHRRPVTAHHCSAALQHFQTSTKCCLEFARRLSKVSQATTGGGKVHQDFFVQENFDACLFRMQSQACYGKFRI